MHHEYEGEGGIEESVPRITVWYHKSCHDDYQLNSKYPLKLNCEQPPITGKQFKCLIAIFVKHENVKHGH